MLLFPLDCLCTIFFAILLFSLPTPAWLWGSPAHSQDAMRSARYYSRKRIEMAQKRQRPAGETKAAAQPKTKTTKLEKLSAASKKDTKKAVAAPKKEAKKTELKDAQSDMDSDLGLDENDQFDVEGVNGSESESESEASEAEEDAEGSEDDDESFPLKKKKKAADDGRGTFANAFNAILGSKLKAYDRKDPILVRNKSTLKKLESDKLEAKAKRLLLSEKKDIYDKQRIRDLRPTAEEPEKARAMLEKERQLKKVAQRGVVKLFNAVLATQVSTSHELEQERIGLSRKEELVNEISKLKFLDLVKAAGEE